MFSRFTLLFLLLLFTAGCYEKGRKMQAAIGLPGKINIVMPVAMKSHPTGKIIDSIFTAELEVFPRDEQLFNVRYVNPDQLNNSHKSIRNLIFVFTYDDRSADAGKIKSLIKPESLNSLMADTAAFVYTQSDVFARGQEIMYLFAADKPTLLRKIKLNAKKLTDHFNEKEKQRLKNGLLKSKANQALAERLTKKYGINIKIPFGYQLADQQQDFIWLRQINPADDKDVWIARKKFSGMQAFEQKNLISFRNSICRQYLFEDPEKPDTYLVTETSLSFKPVITRTVNFNNLYAVEMRGLWKTNIPSMGGPFLGYAMVDEATGYFYYIEGFTFSPAKSQREIMRELEVILSSFNFSQQKSAVEKSNPV